LSLIKEALYDIPFPVLFLNTGFVFREVNKFMNQIAKEWNLDLIKASNKQARYDRLNPYTFSRFECCTKLKTLVLKNIINKNNYDAVIVSIRRDEHGIRSMERYMSPRDKDFKWNIVKDLGKDTLPLSLQDAELSGWNIYATDFGNNCNYVRVHPLLHWNEIDVWKYTKSRDIPVNPLYYARDGYRFRSLGCPPCTEPIRSDANTIDKIIKELESTNIEERTGRAQDKEEFYMMERLRSLGYL